METPSSTKRVTRSQAHSKPALVDITNESPIIGLANKSYFGTPSSGMGKIKIGTPGSGEALLRDQVKSLLDKVEEEAEFSKLSPYVKLFNHFSKMSPINVLAPTPANTPQIPNLSGSQIMELGSVTPCLVEDKLFIPQMCNGISERKDDSVTKSLLFEFSDSSEERKEKIFTDDDNESVWSLQVNVGSSAKNELTDVHDGEENCGEEDEDEYEDVVNELCDGLNKVNLVGETRKTGKHSRFVYDSDGELVDVEEEDNALQLRGLPKPEGKHIRFQEEDDDSAEE